MIPHRIRVKLYAHDATATDVAPFVSLFHQVIREAQLPGLWIDVVDYAHVVRGPGALLVGHEADLSWDMLDGRPGLAWTRKRGEELELEQALVSALAAALNAADVIEAKAETPLSRGSMRVTFVDRLRATRDPAVVESYRAALEAAGRQALGDAAAVTEDETDPRANLSFELRA